MAASLPLSPEAARLRSLLASGALMHPYLSRGYFSRPPGDDCALPEDITASDVCDNFVDLAAALSMCCGVAPPSDAASDEHGSWLDSGMASGKRVEREIHRRRQKLAADIGGESTTISDGTARYERRHIVLVLCDGMGNSILEGALPDNSFLRRHNDPNRLRAVFPSTTPAALTTLATAAWPGRHGMPGWNLRDKKGCDLPGNKDGASPPVQLLVLSDRIRDARSGKLASEVGFETWDEVFIEEPWARKLSDLHAGEQPANRRRKMIYVNAYNGDDYQNWSQGSEQKPSDATDFSSWFIGDDNKRKDTKDAQSTLFETAKIEETAYDTLGTPEGSADAIQYFRNGIDIALQSIADAERAGESTFVYLYTAHPDKHMHALGVEHEEVKTVVQGIDEEVERFLGVLSDREALRSGRHHSNDQCHPDEPNPMDVAVVVTADHGHVTVNAADMVPLPDNILELLEYACVGVHGKGRHGYFHGTATAHSTALAGQSRTLRTFLTPHRGGGDRTRPVWTRLCEIGGAAADRGLCEHFSQQQDAGDPIGCGEVSADMPVPGRPRIASSRGDEHTVCIAHPKCSCMST